MKTSYRSCALVCALAAWAELTACRIASADAYDPPVNYYSAATGTGATLKSQLTTIMSTGHIQRTYGDFRFSSAIIDADPNVPGNLLTVYTRTSVPAAWDNGITWNREHTWPDSLQPQDANNNSTGAIADHHMLRPAVPSVNGSRGNKPYGLDNTTGANQHVGSYYFPGDADKGDMARTQFYAATRWAAQGFTLVDTLPSGTQMGDLSSLINWHYLDVPDTFERRRNQAVYSQAMNPSYYQNNRNAYVDRPEYVWSVFVDQMNDSQITIAGGTPTGNGGSTRDVNLGSVIVGAPLPAAQSFTLNKAGLDGTYFEVTPGGAATSSITGRYNAFANNTTGTKSIDIGLAASTATAGLKSGTVVVDNLDVTNEGGAGVGANDGNDAFNVNLSVLDHANASFAGLSDLNSLTIDFGSVPIGSGLLQSSFDVFNLVATAGFTAPLDLTSFSGAGSTSAFTTTLAATNNIAAGGSQLFAAMFDTSSPGSFAASYTLAVSDDTALAGAVGGQQLTLNLLGNVVAVPEPAAALLLTIGALALGHQRRRTAAC
ncbi:MAG: endonuclease [Pirellulales bacterium]